MVFCCPPDLVSKCHGLLEDEFFNAFIDESRVNVFLLLMEFGEMSVNDVSSRMKINQSNVSRHLTFLKRADIAKSRKEGREAYYRINYENLARRLQSILSIVHVCCGPGMEKK